METVRALMAHPLMPAPPQMSFDVLSKVASPHSPDSASNAEILCAVAPFYPAHRVRTVCCWTRHPVCQCEGAAGFYCFKRPELDGGGGESPRGWWVA